MLLKLCQSQAEASDQLTAELVAAKTLKADLMAQAELAPNSAERVDLHRRSQANKNGVCPLLLLKTSSNHENGTSTSDSVVICRT